MKNDREGLNQQQIEAVNHLDGPLLILAGAGSGKTRVVTCRIVNLLNSGIHPSAILGLTFTNKAAAEMKERVRKLTNRYVLISTFHSLGARILRESISALGYTSNFSIYDEEDADKLLKSCLESIPLYDKKSETKTIRSLISKAKQDLLSPGDVGNGSTLSQAEEIFPQVYATYQMRLKECNALDFDDLLYLTVRLFREHPRVLEMYQDRWSHLLVDEYQDTNATQYTIIQLLARKSQNLFVVGDPDQSIYSWRGATIGNILNFEKEYPHAKVVRLEQNYRSCNNILNAANALIENNSSRYKKELWSHLGDGEKIKRYLAGNDQEEAQFVVERVAHYHKNLGVPYEEMAILYRTNSQSRIFEDHLLLRRIPYVIIGGLSFYQRKEIKDVLSFLRMVQTGTDLIAFTRSINLPKRGIGAATLGKIQEGATKEGLSIFDYVSALIEEKPLKHIVKLSAKQKESFKDYIQIICQLRLVAKNSLCDLVKDAIHNTGYLEILREDRETYDERRSNLEGLVSKAAEWEVHAEDKSLTAFLTELSLKSSLDHADTSQDVLRLMTLHNGKGLEFKVVFIVGLEEDLLPHINSKENMHSLEEERRLCYVGITRAKEHLYLTHARERIMWGMLRTMNPSRFIYEIPMEHCEKIIKAPKRW